MNRIIIKDLPKFSTKEEIEKEFSKHGTITDIYMLRNSRNNRNTFRRVCFVGYGTSEEAKVAVEYRNNSMFCNHKIRVELCTKEETKESKKPLNQHKLSSSERQAYYNREFYITNLQEISTAAIESELNKIGKLEQIEECEKGIRVKFEKRECALDFYKNCKVICGRRINIKIFDDTRSAIDTSHYSTLFFDFQMVLSTLTNKSRENLLQSKSNVGISVSLAETDLVQKTKHFLAENGIDLNSAPVRDKSALIVRSADLLGVLDQISCKFTTSVAPSGALAILHFENEKEAAATQKQLNLKRHKNGIVYAEYSLKGTSTKSVSETISPEKPSQTKLIVKNLPFQATKSEVSKLFGCFTKVVDVRIPQKEDGTARGFCFITVESTGAVDHLIDVLGVSTHLYGRRLILERALK
ncbi:MRD1 [Enterospora canceri]|uniref:MRD1 n=1 Tax=Enterospora canceri TaxID=1081671 RepID=A0A1Y1S711_9MICR|nr:MRD1 [Enterospora canceri]